MKDIAKECGVSTATVSSASARALATGKTNNFGVFVPHSGNSTHKQRLLQALAEEAEKAGYHLVLLTGKCLKQQVTNMDAVFAIDISPLLSKERRL